MKGKINGEQKTLFVAFRDRRQDWTSHDLGSSWRTTSQIRQIRQIHPTESHPRLRGPYLKSFLKDHVSYRAEGWTLELY